MGKKMIPEVRFDGFGGNWRDSKLSSLVDVIGGGTPSTKIGDYWNGDISWYSPNEIGNEKYVNNSNRNISELGLAESSANMLPANKTVLFTSRATIGDMAILKKDGTTNQGFQSLVVKDPNDVEFIYYSGFKIKEYALEKATGSTFLEVSGKTLKEMELAHPGIEEQQSIGRYFKDLDFTISSKESELQKLTQFKQAMRQKMFPKEGERKPEIRVEGFSGEWKEEKLGSILDYEQPTKYIVESDKYIDSQKTPVLTAGKSLLLGYTDETQGIYKADDERKVIIFDDFTTSSHIINYDFKVKSSALKLLTSTSDEFDVYFAHELIRSMNYQPGNHERHWISIFAQFDVLAPSKDEQIAIGNFFKELDNKIKLEEQNLEKLEQFKKAMLQKMFV